MRISLSGSDFVTASGSSIFPSLFLGFMILLRAVSVCVTVYLIVLLIRALRKYLKSNEVRKQNAELFKSLGEILKEHRTRCKMTQEFVAEHLGVSRQAVSKWENGTSDPSTSNLLALAKLYGIRAEALLKSIDSQ